MPHAYIVRKIPPLAQVLARFTGFPPKQSKQAVVLAELRRVSRRLQRAGPESFYSMREVASFFHVPLRTVAITYEALEQEGLLIRLRGAQTKLAGKKSAAQSPVRGVVGLPLWLPSIGSSPYIRSLHMDLDERLRRHGFVADSIFFRSNDDSHPDFSSRLQTHRLDAVLWLTANFLSAQVFLTLRDRGLRQILVLPSETPLTVPATVYLQNWQPAYRTMAATWSEAGITRVLVPLPDDPAPIARILRSFSTVMKNAGIIVSALAGSPRDFIALAQKECRDGTTALAFLEWHGADAVCNGYPQIIAGLSRLTRIGFCRGRIRVPYFAQEGVRADVVLFDPVEVSRRIVEDFAAHFPLPEKVMHTFEATYHAGFDFSDEREYL